MLDYLKRLVTTGAAYQAGDILSKGLAVLTLPIYTRHVTTADYGAAANLLVFVVLVSIVLRLGVGEAFIRYYFDDDDIERRRRLSRSATGVVAWITSIASVVGVLEAQPLSKLVLGYHDATLFSLAVLGLWSFTNLEMVYAQLRVDARAATYMKASIANVVLTVGATVPLVLFGHLQARGLLLGNFGASGVIVVGLWWALRDRVGWRFRWATVRSMLRFGLPTVPADASVYGLQVADRVYLFRVVSHGAAGLYGVAVQLATIVFVAVRGFQYAWPPLAYSITDDDEAARLYSLVTTYYAVATGVVVVAVAVLSRWIVRLLSGPQYYHAYRALPWLALGWALYGLLLVFVVISGRARRTSRNFPAALAGLVANVVLLVTLVPRGGANLGIAGAGIALCGAYLVNLGFMYWLTRDIFRVGFEWSRLARIVAVLGGVAVSGSLLLPTHGIGGLALRVLWLGLMPIGLWVTRVPHEHEIATARRLAVAGLQRAREMRRPPLPPPEEPME
ncbi:MAG TPA: lipopolysaccharide biosynthesis protein [Solirubrobacteraceae bacterium]|nr:lipopolysaccharide biosynthesis protein [Solirubrobacteraceae bacterium]